MKASLKLLIATALAAGWLAVPASLAAQELTTRCDPPAGSLGQLTRAQKKAFMDSQDKFIARRYTDALAELRSLLAELPQGTLEWTALAERTAESALEAGDQAYAISLLRPIEEHDGGDCLARALLARADAESGQPTERDAEINALTALHKQAPESPAGKLDVFLLEKDRVKGGGTVNIWYALRPWAPHNTHISAEILDASGKEILRVDLDSDAGDQVYFRQTHPDLAAKGDRSYSLDIFGAPRSLPGGGFSSPHELLGFFDGAPKYDDVRKRILLVAEHGDEAQKLLQKESQ